jgi:vesicle coat complex subunit
MSYKESLLSARVALLVLLIVSGCFWVIFSSNDKAFYVQYRCAPDFTFSNYFSYIPSENKENISKNESASIYGYDGKVCYEIESNYSRPVGYEDKSLNTRVTTRTP